HYFFDLQVQHILVAGPVRFIEDPERSWQMTFRPRIVEKANKDLRFVEIALVVYPTIVFAKAAAELDHDGAEAVQPDPLLPFRAEYERLPLFEEYRLDRLASLFCKDLEGAVIKYIAVLIDLQEGCSFVGVTAQEHLLQMLGIAVHASRHETGIRTHRQGEGIEGMIDASERRGFRDLMFLRRRRILALGQPIDLVVEEHDIEIEIPPQQMNGVIPADTQTVPVPGDYPNAQFGSRGFETRRDGRRSAMDGMHPVGAHIIWKAAAAADARNDDDVLAGDSEGRHHLLNLCEDGVIYAARAPAHFLVRSEVFCSQGRRDRC